MPCDDLVTEYRRLAGEVEPRTLVAPDRCFMIYQWATHAAKLGGAAAELGVYQGGTAKLIARACPGKQLHLFDTFKGLPQPDPGIDVHKAGEYGPVCMAKVARFLSDCPNVVFHPGLFPQTTRGLEELFFAFVHADGDLYSSTKDFLEFFWPRMVPGGVMIFDDYLMPDCPGVEKALREFLRDKPDRPMITALHQCLIIRDVDFPWRPA